MGDEEPQRLVHAVHQSTRASDTTLSAAPRCEPRVESNTSTVEQAADLDDAGRRLSLLLARPPQSMTIERIDIAASKAYIRCLNESGQVFIIAQSSSSRFTPQPPRWQKLPAHITTLNAYAMTGTTPQVGLRTESLWIQLSGDLSVAEQLAILGGMRLPDE